MEQGQVFKKHRHSIRLSGYDYSAEGSYFITLVTHEREHLFGCIADGEMRLNDYGVIVREEWLKTKEYRPNVELIDDEFVVMPNHFHGIVHIIESETQSCKSDDEQLVRAYSHTPLRVHDKLTSPSKTLGSMVRGFKAAVTTRINTLLCTPGQPVWLRNYYEHIIRSEKDYENIVNYIYLNPLNWDIKDEYGVGTGV